MLILPRNDKPANGMFIELCNLGIEIFSCLLLQRMARIFQSMSIPAIRCNRRQEKISMHKLHNSINILHIPISAKLHNI